MLLDKSKDFDIRESIVSGYNVDANRPSRDSRESVGKII